MDEYRAKLAEYYESATNTSVKCKPKEDVIVVRLKPLTRKPIPIIVGGVASDPAQAKYISLLNRRAADS